FREKVRHQPFPAVSHEGPENAPGILKPSRGNTQARKRDHRIPSPVLKERKTSQNGLSLCGFPSGDKLHRRPGKGSGKGRDKSCRFLGGSLEVFCLLQDRFRFLKDG